MILVACYATQNPALSVNRLVGLLVGQLVTFFMLLRYLATLLLLKGFNDLKYGLCFHMNIGHLVVAKEHIHSFISDSRLLANQIFR